MTDKFKAGDLVKHIHHAEFAGVFTEYRVQDGVRFGYMELPNGKISGGWFDSSLAFQVLQPVKPKVTRTARFKEGDVISLHDDGTLHDPQARTGDICTVVRVDAGGCLDTFYRLERKSDGYRFGCYEHRLKHATPAQAAGMKEGDKFVTVQNAIGFAKDTVVTLERDDGTEAPLFVGANSVYNCGKGGKQGAYLNINRVIPLAQYEAAQAVPTPAVEAVAEAPQFKVGDRVKVMKTLGRGFECDSRGKTGTITQIDGTSLPVQVHFEDRNYDWGKFEELELVEIDTATVKQKLAQIAKLTAEVQELLG